MTKERGLKRLIRFSIPDDWRKGSFWKETVAAYLYILPALAILGLFVFYPFFSAFRLSTFKWSLVHPPGTFIGWGNYRYIFHDKYFWRALWHTFYYVGVNVPVTLLLALLVAFGVLLTLLLVRPLNLLLMGEDYARSVGMHIRRTRILIFLVTGLLAGGVTAFCGPIGFVGIVVPHLARITLRTSDVRQVLPATLLLGASLLLLGDILSHLPGEGGVLPINAVTAVLGIPMIIWMVLQRQRLSSLM